MSLQVGDVVRLKSGSPPLTIAVVDEKQTYVKWFDGATLNSDRIEAAALEKIEKEDRGSPLPSATS